MWVCGQGGEDGVGCVSKGRGLLWSKGRRYVECVSASVS